MNLRNVLIAAFLLAVTVVVAPPVAVAQDRNDVPQSARELAVSAAKAAMMSKPDVALLQARKAKAAAEMLPSQSRAAAIAEAQWLEGEALTRLNHPEQAQPIIDAALVSAKSVAPHTKLHADLLKSRASIAMLNGEPAAAMAMLQEAHGIYGKLGDTRSQAIALQNIGSIYSDARDHRRALDYYEQAANVHSEDPMLTLAANNNRGNAYKDLREFDRAEQAYRQALAAARQTDSPLLEVRIITNIASAQFLQGKLNEADASARRGLGMATGAAAEWQPFLYGVRAQIAHARGDDISAAALIQRTFMGVDTDHSTMLFRDFHETASKVYHALGHDRVALAHLSALKRLDDEAREVAASTNSALMSARFDAANQELRIVKSENRLKSVTTLAILGAIAGLLVLAAVMTALVSTRRSRHRVSEANARLTHAARHDSLTGLSNRAHFQELVGETLARARQNDTPCALLLIDLDRFKWVNDTFGHSGGDELLCGVARRLEDLAGTDAHAFRLGGDEFAVLVPDASVGHAVDALAHAIVAEMGRPFAISDSAANIGATVGIAFGPDHGAGVSALTRSADLALYTAKAHGRGRAQHFERWMLDEADGKRQLEADLHEALVKDQLSLVFQPIVDAASGKVVGREALVRWDHPSRGEIEPSVFVAIAEETGVIDRIGTWVLRSACHEAAHWPDQAKVAVNLSVIQIEGDGLVNAVLSALGWSGLSADRLELEVTESVLLQRGAHMEATFEKLRSLGVGLVLDDFGTGYSSMSYLQKASFSKIKIDKSFVQAAEQGRADSLAIVKSIVGLAKGLRMITTAEGIETEAQKKLMKSLGCAQLQGFLFGRPEAMPMRSETTASNTGMPRRIEAA